MTTYSVATTKDKLSSLIDRAQAGEEVVITRRGKPAARLVPIEGASAKDPRRAAEMLRQWQRSRPVLPSSIPVERFYEWLYEDPEG